MHTCVYSWKGNNGNKTKDIQKTFDRWTTTVVSSFPFVHKVSTCAHTCVCVCVYVYTSFITYTPKLRTKKSDVSTAEL